MSSALDLDFFSSETEEADLTPQEIVRAWEDRRFRSRLTPAQLKRLPAHPTGAVRLMSLVDDSTMNFGVSHDACSGNNCSTNNCSTNNCSTQNCSTNNCSTENCSTNNCSTNNCSTHACSVHHCGGR